MMDENKILEEYNMFGRTDKFEEHILKSVGGKIYLECCVLELDPIEVYKKKKELEKNGKNPVAIIGTSTEFGYLVTYVLEDHEEGFQEVNTIEDALDRPVFAYVQNVTADELSEYGYVVVTKENGVYVRVE